RHHVDPVRDPRRADHRRDDRGRPRDGQERRGRARARRRDDELARRRRLRRPRARAGDSDHTPARPHARLARVLHAGGARHHVRRLAERRGARQGTPGGGLGLWLATIGLDPVTGIQRYTFGQLFLWDGIGLVPVTIGFYAIPELIEMATLLTLFYLKTSRARWPLSVALSLAGCAFVFGLLQRGLGVPFPPGRILVWLGFVP